MSVLLFGANPGLTLFGDDDPAGGGPPVAFASAWRVDWSVRGAGTALVVWHAGRVRVVAGSAELGRWLADAFTRHFPEVAGLPWAEPELTEAPVTIELDHGTGLRAAGADVGLRIDGPLDRRAVAVESFPGNGLRLSNVYVPCRSGSLHLGGRPVGGAPRVVETPRASSTAFLADAEVWSSP